MCYSAQIKASYAKYVRAWGADISIREFYRLYWLRSQGAKVRIPKAIDAWFASPANDDERQIRDLIEAWNVSEAGRLEAELFTQKQRLNKAVRTLAEKPTKKAAEDQRIATNKIEAALGKLSALRRAEIEPEDARFFPGWYAPVIVADGDRLAVKPMRYQCRLPGWTEAIERKFPGTYNARRDRLEESWSRLFGHKHGVMIVNAFFENVSRHAMEGRELAPGEREENVVLEFRPRPPEDMMVACLWSRSGAGDDELLSFAAITDEPPPEVAAAGHDRCIIPLREANVSRWLHPDASDLPTLYALLDDRDRPYYEHRIAA